MHGEQCCHGDGDLSTMSSLVDLNTFCFLQIHLQIYLMKSFQGFLSFYLDKHYQSVRRSVKTGMYWRKYKMNDVNCSYNYSYDDVINNWNQQFHSYDDEEEEEEGQGDDNIITTVCWVIVYCICDDDDDYIMMKMRGKVMTIMVISTY